jgi:hypothetical protein
VDWNQWESEHREWVEANPRHVRALKELPTDSFRASLLAKLDADKRLPRVDMTTLWHIATLFETRRRLLGGVSLEPPRLGESVLCEAFVLSENVHVVDKGGETSYQGRVLFLDLKRGWRGCFYLNPIQRENFRDRGVNNRIQVAGKVTHSVISQVRGQKDVYVELGHVDAVRWGEGRT